MMNPIPMPDDRAGRILHVATQLAVANMQARNFGTLANHNAASHIELAAYMLKRAEQEAKAN